MTVLTSPDTNLKLPPAVPVLPSDHQRLGGSKGKARAGAAVPAAAVGGGGAVGKRPDPDMGKCGKCDPEGLKKDTLAIISPPACLSIS